MPKKILVVDDNETVRELLIQIVEDLGYQGIAVPGGEEGLAKLESEDFSVVFTDLKMPRMDGMEFLRAVQEKDPTLPVVMITAYGTIETAVQAMRRGAVDFVLKPFPVPQIKVILDRVFHTQDMELENRKLRELIRIGSPDASIVGEDLRMKEVYQLIEKVAPTDATVMIEGESGTGKELVARTIHKHSRRKDGQFVSINCAAVTETLIESEIFGHEAGAFTGAVGRKLGLIEVAEGGTLFLDEIGETPQAFQAKLLRAIQEREFLRVGGTRPVTVDTRFIAATNKDLKAEVAAGRFREDLYYRLNVFPIPIPPLRERKPDIPLLIRHFLDSFSPQKEGELRERITPQAEAILAKYLWPGNVRELRNVIERAVILAGGEPILPEHLPTEVQTRRERLSELTRLATLPFREAKSQLEARYFRQLMREFQGNVSRAAEHAGISRGTFHEKLNKLGIHPNDFRGGEEE
ncbi:MAG: sigma-54-dependent transcriptional regulator [Planctomycetota bacterium]|jgi:DNA-binding NtrC family response regulator